MKLISDKEFIDVEILKYALQTHIACFQGNFQLENFF
jgi:hypothetical protein